MLRGVLCFVGALLTGLASAQESKVCPGAEIQSINVSAEIEKKAPLDTRPETIEIAPGYASNPNSRPAEGTVTAVALGPVLGSMDSPKVKTEVTCTANGFLLTATITRSADFHGAALQNVDWRPRATITVLLRQPEIAIETTWKVRLTTGVELHHAQTPPYPERTFPIKVTKVVHLDSRHN